MHYWVKLTGTLRFFIKTWLFNYRASCLECHRFELYFADNGTSGDYQPICNRFPLLRMTKLAWSDSFLSQFHLRMRGKWLLHWKFGFRSWGKQIMRVKQVIPTDNGQFSAINWFRSHWCERSEKTFHSVCNWSNWTNQVACFDILQKSDQSDSYTWHLRPQFSVWISTVCRQQSYSLILRSH